MNDSSTSRLPANYWHNNFIALKTLIRREVLRFMRIWPQTLLPPAVTTILYFVIFGELIGSQIDDIKGFRYVEFIAPGLVLMTALSNAYGNVVSSFYSAKFHRNIEEMLISPMPSYIILAGFVTGGVLRGVTVGIIVTFVAMYFTPLYFTNIWQTIIVMILTCVMFSLAGLINGIYARSFDGISIIPTFVLLPLTYLGGVFYSIDMLPEFWRNISLFNPLFYILNAYRESTLGVSDIPFSTTMIVIIPFITALTLFCLYLLRKGVGIRS